MLIYSTLENTAWVEFWPLVICTVDEMIERFDVHTSEGEATEVHHLSGGRGIVDGHQFMSQAIVAASRQHAPKTVRSVTMQFCRTASEDSPADLQLETLHSGRSFASLGIQVFQQGKLCATGQMLLGAPVDDFIAHEHSMPDVIGPEQAREIGMPVLGRHVRMVEDHDPMELDNPLGPPELRAWLRYDKDLQEQGMEQAFLAHFTGHLSIAAALRAHEGLSLARAHQDFSSGILAIQVVFHRPVNTSDWMLYDHHCTHAGEGLSYTRAEIYTQSGNLLASFNQQNMIRAMPETRSSSGPGL